MQAAPASSVCMNTMSAPDCTQSYSSPRRTQIHHNVLRHQWRIVYWIFYRFLEIAISGVSTCSSVVLNTPIARTRQWRPCRVAHAFPIFLPALITEPVTLIRHCTGRACIYKVSGSSANSHPPIAIRVTTKNARSIDFRVPFS